MLAKDGNGTADFENGNEDGWPVWVNKKGKSKNQVRRLEKERTPHNRKLTRQWEM
jgi:hypothetical protein